MPPREFTCARNERMRVRKRQRRKRGSFYRGVAHTEDKVQEHLNEVQASVTENQLFIDFAFLKVKVSYLRNARVSNTVFSLVRRELYYSFIASS